MAAAALEARSVSFAYRRDRPVLRDVSFRADAGEILAVLGTSGSGKTTLLKICRGLLRPSSGEVDALGTVITPRGATLDPRIAYIPQQLGLVRSLSVLENVCIGGLGTRGLLESLARLVSPPAASRASELLESVGIGHKLYEKAHALSGGERQRVAIARALMQSPRILLADEFISQLDPYTTGEMMRIIRAIASDGVAVIMATHEQSVVRDHADRAMVLREGRKVVDVRTHAVPMSEIAEALR